MSIFKHSLSIYIYKCVYIYIYLCTCLCSQRMVRLEYRGACIKFRIHTTVMKSSDRHNNPRRDTGCTFHIIYICIQMYIYIYIYVYEYIQINANAYLHLSMHMYIYAHVNIQLSKIYKHKLIYVHLCMQNIHIDLSKYIQI